ncbi:unnamed protein product [Kuraishia capsulata CBS 1993]|uniref:Uncharacterized protein n=1 Tax=Kuraishia capsulata CBS 1993 TaxID=1382522 RepID=W6MTQ2_9ASCO|nr:uncharacterized protein KUCA_T00005847001 [Kuraishia capsulata CBS 1993]CDK29853.1 unnamed protein product [Kuraishia capsulata CBS 1993]
MNRRVHRVVQVSCAGQWHALRWPQMLDGLNRASTERRQGSKKITSQGLEPKTHPKAPKSSEICPLISQLRIEYDPWRPYPVLVIYRIRKNKNLVSGSTRRWDQIYTRQGDVGGATIAVHEPQHLNLC